MKKLLFCILIPIALLYAAAVLVLYGVMTIFEMLTETTINSEKFRFLETPITLYLKLLKE